MNGFERSVRYTNPKESREGGASPKHLFQLYEGGKRIGAAEVEYFSKPIPYYQISDLYVEPESQNQGNASRIMSKVETFLEEKKKPGVLIDNTAFQDAHGMYERRGWIKMSWQDDLLVYNWPQNVSTDVLKEYPNRYTDCLEREGFKKVLEGES